MTIGSSQVSSGPHHVIEETGAEEEHWKFRGAASRVARVLFAVALRRGGAAALSHLDHDRLVKHERAHKDKEHVVDKGETEQEEADACAREANHRQKGHAEAHPKQVLQWRQRPVRGSGHKRTQLDKNKEAMGPYPDTCRRKANSQDSREENQPRARANPPARPAKSATLVGPTKMESNTKVLVLENCLARNFAIICPVQLAALRQKDTVT